MREPTQDELRRFVDQNVIYCVSTLIYELSRTDFGPELMELGAFHRKPDHSEKIEELEEEIAEIVDQIDLLDNAIDNLEDRIYDQPLEDPEINILRQRQDAAGNTKDELIVKLQTLEEQKDELEREQEEGDEVYEHWIVDRWFAEKLAARDEVIFEFMGMTIWGRTCTGQAILLDGVISDIWKSLQGA
jgi:hypothetical protein